MRKRGLVAGFIVAVALLVGCADADIDPGPAAPTTTTEELSTTTGDAVGNAAGTPCGPNGLVCNANQTCCARGPRPPQGVVYLCLKKGAVCDP